ncbi:hypothetical protein HDU76_001646 [Blyttiomyces sp. JEL0837]|nr:hypothetical protein HDU76_001646 [Blyttiomyces sp. JEL0837]
MYAILPRVQPLINNVTAKAISLPVNVWRNLENQLHEFVNFLHEHNTVHRDIKPANLGYIPNDNGSDGDVGQLVVFDFDLATLWKSEYERDFKKGFDPFMLDKEAVKIVANWMRKASSTES